MRSQIFKIQRVMLFDISELKEYLLEKIMDFKWCKQQG